MDGRGRTVNNARAGGGINEIGLDVVTLQVCWRPFP